MAERIFITARRLAIAEGIFLAGTGGQSALGLKVLGTKRQKKTTIFASKRN
jgi:hypothetical protein